MEQREAIYLMQKTNTQKSHDTVPWMEQFLMAGFYLLLFVDTSPKGVYLINALILGFYEPNKMCYMCLSESQIRKNVGRKSCDTDLLSSVPHHPRSKPWRGVYKHD